MHFRMLIGPNLPGWQAGGLFDDADSRRSQLLRDQCQGLMASQLKGHKDCGRIWEFAKFFFGGVFFGVLVIRAPLLGAYMGAPDLCSQKRDAPHLRLYLSIYLSICLFFCLSVCRCIYKHVSSSSPVTSS